MQTVLPTEIKTVNQAQVKVNAPQIAIDSAKAHKSFVVILCSVGNPDYGQTLPQSLPELVPFGQLSEVSAICRDYISKYNLGGGNWGARAGEIYHPVNGLIAHVSYNGRIWAQDGKEITGAALTEGI